MRIVLIGLTLLASISSFASMKCVEKFNAYGVSYQEAAEFCARER